MILRNCNNSKISLNAPQVRIHDSFDSNFFINSNSTIIENCERLKFLKYNFQYFSFKEHFEFSFSPSNFVFQENGWKNITDFNWLKETKSPNFEIDESQQPFISPPN